MTENNENQAPAKSALPSPPWLPWAFAAAIIVLSCIAYWGGLGNGFTNWDDNWLITDNRFVHGLSWHNLQAMFNPMAPREELGNEYLPLRDLSYAVNYALDGLNPRGYHATNLLFHIFNSLLVMLLAVRLTGRRWVGGVAGVLFAVHPVHVEAVSWLSSRKDLLSTFFMLLSANFYLAARRSRSGLMPSESFVQRVRHSTRLGWMLSLLFFICALLSKMTAVVLPALLLLVELFRRRELHALPRARRALTQAPFWGVAALFTALASHIGSGLMREPYGDGRWQSLLTATSAITRDFQVLLFGWPMHAAVDLPVQTGFSLPVVTGLLLLLALLALGVAGWRSSRAGWDSRPSMLLGVAGFGALWFLVALSPVSNFLVQIGTVFAERYLYIPSIGFCIAVAALGVLGAELMRKRDNLRVLAPALGVLGLAVAGLGVWGTMQATRPWVGSVSLWTHALEHDPGNHVAHFNLGREFEELALLEADEKQRDELLQRGYEQYQLALDNPARTYRYDPARLYAAMALNLVHRKQPEKALPLLEQANKHIEQPWRDQRARNDIEALIANPRGLALSALGRHEEAVAAFEEALSKSERYAGAHINLASELTRKALAGDAIDEALLNKARSHLADYERKRGRDALLVEARARLLLAEFDKRLELSGQGGGKETPAELQPLLDESRKLFAELIELRDTGAMPPAAMAAALVEAADAFGRGRAGDPTAEKYLRRALNLSPDYLGLRFLLAQFLFEKADLRPENSAPMRAEATRLLSEELNRHPGYKPALVLKAAGLRQNAVNEAEKLIANWRAEYTAIKKDNDPTWEGLITTLHGRDEFRKQLRVVVALMREALELDPENEQGHALLEGSGIQIARGMWWTGDDQLRVDAEDLLRTAFNARPVDGVVAANLTAFYTDLAEQIFARPPRGKTEEEQRKQEEERRKDLEHLLTNMLTLSERARKILSNKLFKVGREVESGAKQLRDEKGEPLKLSDPARRLAASEFVRPATILNPENVEALDWLKKYYEEEGNFEDALKAFEKLIEALKDRPELMHGVYLSLAQLQLDFGQQLLTAYKSKLKLEQHQQAIELRQKAIQAYLDALETTGVLIDNPENPEKLNLPIRMRGMAAQRLAYLVINDAEKYYSVALEAYALAPLDFQLEIAEVSEKRAWFEKDPDARKRQLEQVRADKLRADPNADVSSLNQQIIELDRRITRRNAEDLLRQGKLEQALRSLDEAFKAPTPALFAVRGEIYQAMAAQQSDPDERDALVVKSARDYVRALTDPEALVKGADLYWSDEAMRFEEDYVVRARLAYAKAEEVISLALDTIDEGTTQYTRYDTLLGHTRAKLKEMRGMGADYMRMARDARERGKLAGALALARSALEYLGDHAPAWQLTGWILTDMAKAEPEKASDYAGQARDAFLSALRMPRLLTSQRLWLMCDLAALLLDQQHDRQVALEWATRARALLEGDEAAALPADSRALYESRLNELEARLK
ncbi:MAG: hypothetical protein H6841_07560 [Planctomycetes bacterium]|nr:hypothetical protein [Planctomycetota bacterium]MCB9935214.1 hypothetical protein [Planctomycetota bacterium]